MPAVYTRPLPIWIFVRSASLHVGATAVAASLRRQLVTGQYLSDDEFNEAYTAARLTPGTTLLALYAILGFRLGGLRGALLALAAGAMIPGVIVIAMTVAYVANSAHPLAIRALQGASAAALGVLLASVVRLSRPVLERQGWRGLALSAAALGLAITGLVPPIWLLLAGGAIGAVMLR